MNKKPQITILVILLGIISLMLSNCMICKPKSILEIRDYGDGTMERPNGVSPVNKIAEIAVQAPHSPINIRGNGEFTKANGVSAGSGTKQDPYIITNWVIDGNGGYCIYITGTTSYFVIENCTLINTGVGAATGVYFSYVTNGHVKNNTCNNNYNGIWSESSSNNTFTNNNCSGNTYGIWLDGGSFNTLTQNICNINVRGIRIDDIRPVL